MKRAFMHTTLALILLEATRLAAQQTDVYFSPDGGCTDAIVRTLNGATNSIHVQAYSFTSAPIAKALVDAHKRKIKVQVILDKSQRSDKYSSADYLFNSGVVPLIDSDHAIAHNKVIIVDTTKVVTGSFNFSKAAEERNAENVLILHDQRLAMRYLSNWNHHATHSVRYTGRQPQITGTK